ncbi:MAG: PQQ-binding-like beta-propeller repeat protein [Caldilineaceae bacterium]|nr:PQQ-binding-like beta-propeller repeat protein [Caldilineaceae bacterium]
MQLLVRHAILVIVAPILLMLSACVQGRAQPASPIDLTGEWPMEGYGPARSRTIETEIAPPLSGQHEYLLTDAAAQASPVTIAGGLLFVEGKNKLFAVALDSGKEQWQFSLKGAYFSPAVVDGTVFVRSESGDEGYVLALSAATGARLWQYQFPTVGSSYDNIGGHVTSPVVVGGRLLVGAAHSFVALDAATGNEQWVFPTEFPVVSSASIDDDTVYFSDFTRLYAVDLQTGQERWRFDHGKLSLYFAPVLFADQVALSGHDTIYVLNRADGSLAWSRGFADLQMIPAGASARYLFVKSPTQLWALDLRDGRVVWNYAVTNFVSLPAISGDHLFVVTRAQGGSQVRALQERDGQEIWRNDQLEITNAAPVIAGGRVYVRLLDGRVMAFAPS